MHTKCTSGTHSALSSAPSKEHSCLAGIYGAMWSLRQSVLLASGSEGREGKQVMVKFPVPACLLTMSGKHASGNNEAAEEQQPVKTMAMGAQTHWGHPAQAPLPIKPGAGTLFFMALEQSVLLWILSLYQEVKTWNIEDTKAQVYSQGSKHYHHRTIY